MVLRLAIVALVALQRLGELVLSRRWLAPERAAGRAAVLPEPGYAAMVAVHMGWLLGMAAEVLLSRPAFLPAVALPAAAVWGASLALRAWTLATLGCRWHVRLVRRDDQPVVTHGPYRFIRHPNYLVVVLELAAVPVMLGAYGTALVASAANGLVLWRRIVAEEAYLFTVPAYRAAFGHKKRLLPGLF